MKRIRVSFYVVTPESAAQGDFSESGWIDEAGIDCTPDEFDIDEGLTAIDIAIDFLSREGATFEGSEWASQVDPIYDRAFFEQGHEERHDFHFVDGDWTPDEVKAIQEGVKS